MWGVPWMLTYVACIWNRWCYNRKTLCLPGCCQCSKGTACCLHIKGDTFLCLQNLQKLTKDASKCTNLVPLWQRLEAQVFSLENDTKFGLRGTPGGSYESVKGQGGHMTNRSSTFWMGGTKEVKKALFNLLGGTKVVLWLREGSWGSQTQPQTCIWPQTDVKIIYFCQR